MKPGYIHSRNETLTALRFAIKAYKRSGILITNNPFGLCAYLPGIFTFKRRKSKKTLAFIKNNN